MALEDFADREVGIAAAATAVLLSPRVRDVARRGAVYGLAGAMKAGDLAVSTARGAARGAGMGAPGAAQDGEPEQAAEPAPARTRGTRSRPRGTAEPAS
jgi:hypothetical protein